MTLTAPAPTTAPVSPEVAGFLAHLAVALHKLRAYPLGHPMRHTAVEVAYRALGNLLTPEAPFRVGVARNQLVVGEGVTDPAHFIIGDLAVRLHRRQVGAISFRGGVTRGEFTAALEVLATEPARSRRGAIEEPVVSPTDNVEITPIAFDALTLRDDGDGGEVDRLWQELAQAVSWGNAGRGGAGTGGGFGEGHGPGSDGYAQAMVQRLRAPEARAALASVLERLGRVTQTLGGAEREAAEARLGDLLATLPKDAITMLLEIDLGRREGLANLLPAVDWLPTLALVELVESAARAQRQGFSTVFLRLLRKLAGQGRSAGTRRPTGDRDLRLMVKALVEDWTLADPNTKKHAWILDSLARHEMVSTDEGAPTPEGLRLLQIAIETEAVGDLVHEAVEMVVTSNGVDELTRLLAEVPMPNRAAGEIWRQLVTPGQLRRILVNRTDPVVVRRLLPFVGDDGVEVLLDRLLHLPADTRHEVVEQVLALGPGPALTLLKRIELAHPEDRRQLLQVLASVSELPAGFSARSYATAPEPLVRVEALRLMVRQPADREEAIHLALTDDDERVAEVAITAGLEEMPRQSLTRLMLLLNSPRRSVALKAMAIPILAQFDAPSIRQWLVSNLIVQRGWFRRKRLAPKTPVLVAKLTVLAARWADLPAAARALELAARSGDPELVAAVRPGEGQG